jgi:hypothetical protein
MDAELSTTRCCCASKEKSGIEIKLTGHTDGRTTVTGRADIIKHGCVYQVYQYWWDCYTAQQEAGFLRIAAGADFHLYGYSLGGTTYSKTAQPGFLASLFGVGDPYHLAMDALAIYVYCGDDGYKHARLQAGGNELWWTWWSGHIHPPYIELGKWVGPENQRTP